MSERVILLHGLWLRGVAMGHFAHVLKDAGFDAQTFDYASVHGGIDSTIERLHERLGALDDRVHLVGHSLGGVLAVAAAQRDPQRIRGRIVCLGSPLLGSATARRLRHFPGGSLLLGGSAELLQQGLTRWDGQQQVGVIAGRLPIGFGMLLGGLHGQHDGTVAVAETRLPGIADHRVIAAAHTGLPFSDEAARLATAFLKNGCFDG
jgi:pimeloyl-ACP methyl ester carboxylesterase